METIDAFIASKFWHTARVILSLGGVIGVFFLITGALHTKPQRQFAWAAVGLMTLAVIFAMVFETLVPLAEETSWAKAAPAGFGMLGMLIGVALLGYGAHVLVRDIRPPGSERGARRWRRGTAWLALGALILLLAIWLYRRGLA